MLPVICRQASSPTIARRGADLDGGATPFNVELIAHPGSAAIHAGFFWVLDHEQMHVHLLAKDD